MDRLARKRGRDTDKENEAIGNDENIAPNC
jgi:hypothetical protein